ncbi:hypothetical protein FPV67DRAFT_1162742 [Lyophyllum atratum]|nr:hypothetical protein FPV67DRAFT_1162742 [Lyophyllum atratum]
MSHLSVSAEQSLLPYFTYNRNQSKRASTRPHWPDRLAVGSGGTVGARSIPATPSISIQNLVSNLSAQSQSKQDMFDSAHISCHRFSLMTTDQSRIPDYLQMKICENLFLCVIYICISASVCSYMSRSVGVRNLIIAQDGIYKIAFHCFVLQKILIEYTGDPYSTLGVTCDTPFTTPHPSPALSAHRTWPCDGLEGPAGACTTAIPAPVAASPAAAALAASSSSFALHQKRCTRQSWTQHHGEENKETH